MLRHAKALEFEIANKAKFEASAHQAAIASKLWHTKVRFNCCKIGTGNGKTFIGLLILNSAIDLNLDDQPLIYAVPSKSLRNEAEEVVKALPSKYGDRIRVYLIDELTPENC